MDFHLPQLGEGVYEAEMVRWLVNAGDRVHHGQGLMEVMTDKATMEVPAPFAGTVTELRVQPGSTVQVGDLILSYTPAGAVPEGPPGRAPSAWGPSPCRTRATRSAGTPPGRAGHWPPPSASPPPPA